MDTTLISFSAYLLILIGVAFYSRKFSSRHLSAFFLADRQLNGFVVALSAVASGRSAWLLLGVTGMAYTRGFSAIWAVAGYTLVEFWMFLSLAPRLRKASGDMKDITIPDFLESRLGDRQHLMRYISVFIIIIFMIAYISAQFVGGGKAFSSTFDLDLNSSIILTAFFVILYTLLGGFLAVSITDVIQAIFMLLALIVVPIVALIDIGGWSELVSKVNILNPALFDPLALSFGVFIGFIGIGLGSPGSPHILVRYMSVKDISMLKLAAYTGTGWNIIMGFGAVLLGVIGSVYFPDVGLLPSSDPENLFPSLAREHLHPVLFGMTISAVVAAVMSTADSMLLVASSALVRDLVQRVWTKGADIPEETWVRYGKWSIVGLSILALLLGFIAQDLVFWLVLFAWSGLGAAFGPVIILSLFWKRTTYLGAIAGMITGTVVTFVWRSAPFLKEKVYELIPAFLLAMLMTYIVSLLTFNKKSD